VVPLPRRLRPATLDRAAAWFAVTGAGIGAAAGGIRLAFDPLVGRAAASVLALIALVSLTGALHVDGLADTADGLGARGGGAERRLAVMRDSATGTFGVLAVVFWALLVVAALAPLPGLRALRALVVAGALARWAALVHGLVATPARADGLGSALLPRLGEQVVAAVTALAAALAIAGPAPGGAGVGAALLVGVATAWYSRRMLGGRTGDTLGAAVALTEAGVLLTLLAFWR
jgi:adenosylcobinamide-GDP ribazoletransferase